MPTSRDLKNEKSRLRFCYIGKKKEFIGIKYFAETSIVRHTKVTEDKSIYDNDLVYWSERGRALGNRAFSKSILRVLRNQNYKCTVCGLKFLPGDVIEIDHIVPKTFGGPIIMTIFKLFMGTVIIKSLLRRRAV